MMKSIGLSALLVGVAACSQSTGSSASLFGPNGELPSTRASSSGYKLVFSFDGTDGSIPSAELLAVKGILYGTTLKGGTDGQGTVFDLSASGTEHVLHSFAGYPNDGQSPEASLIDVRGELYGTTLGGGASSCGGGTLIGCGVVFEISTSGKERILVDCKDAVYVCLPNAGLISVKGVLYGTADAYGGTVYATTTSGKSNGLYNFKGYPSDGSRPHAPLMAANGVMYGETVDGGAHKIGAIFSVTTAGQESLLYSFDKPDGRYPQGGLIEMNGALYGTTEEGGTGRCRHTGGRRYIFGCGTVFEVSTSGAEHVLYSFKDESDGAYPQGALIAVKGALYGTTSSGGTYGGGTVFRISSSGSFSVLHTFGGSSDGAHPSAGLTDVNGTLYGTTAYGGTSGDGTVFAVTP